ncbi:adenosylcobalamin-dependent ribonucleoside-diphosphate reductase [Candidatus Woesearchaeota archaeon]|nr:MAG: adenosylcobalamin-dependent ribonucleoside-diphosphate reductase [Candidatus Woesearchaeota archaeon]
MVPPSESGSAKTSVRRICKRDGSIVPFDRGKIENAISKAVAATGGSDLSQVSHLADLVVEEINKRFHRHSIPAVEEIQDIVENVLIREGHAETAKAYILYRQKRTELREAKKLLLGFVDDSKLSLNGAWIAKERYLLRDKAGVIIESPLQMFRRVAKNVAAVERKYLRSGPIDSRTASLLGVSPGTEVSSYVKQLEEDFFSAMSSLSFVPAGRILANTGTKNGQLANAFVVPVGDSIDTIYDALKEQALIHRAGGGTGFDFSRLRPKGDSASVSGGVAAGPVSFLKLFDESSARIKIGTRRASNMGMLSVHHPDVLDFITLKTRQSLPHFNISVALTDSFMKAVLSNGDYAVRHPSSGEVVKRIKARQVFDLLVTTAWQCGDPGILFIDRINSANPTSYEGPFEGVSACAEMPLYAHESAVLGSINLDKFVKNKGVDWKNLERTVSLAVQFLDNCIDISSYPTAEIEKVTKNFRRIGLGVMGWSDMLFQLGIPYDSERAVKLARKVMKFINDTAASTSERIAKVKGSFPLFKKSAFPQFSRRRNASLTAIAPTGSISMLAETSSGIEPHFALSYVKRVFEGKEFLYVNKHFERVARERGFYSDELVRAIAERGNIQNVDSVPDDVKEVFKVSHQISPEWHVKMQAAFQKYVEGAISKTINFPSGATMGDVFDAYLLAYKEGCKGLTIYRDQSLEGQVLSAGSPIS